MLEYTYIIYSAVRVHPRATRIKLSTKYFSHYSNWNIFNNCMITHVSRNAAGCIKTNVTLLHWYGSSWACTRLCVLRLPDSVKHFPLVSHWYGLYPVCMRLCRTRVDTSRNDLLYTYIRNLPCVRSPMFDKIRFSSKWFFTLFTVKWFSHLARSLMPDKIRI